MKLQGQIRKVSTVYRPPAKDDGGEGDLVTTVVIVAENLSYDRIASLHEIQKQEVKVDIQELQLRIKMPEEAKA